MLSRVQRIERLDDNSSFGVGTCWRETRTMLGLPTVVGRPSRLLGEGTYGLDARGA